MYANKEAAVEQTIESNVRDYLARIKENRLPKPSHCPTCGQNSSLIWHGRYMRRLITMVQVYTLPVKRLFCAACRHSFACLPDFVAKFYHYAKGVIHFALQQLRSNSYERVAGLFIATAQRSLAVVTVYLWRRRFS